MASRYKLSSGKKFQEELLKIKWPKLSKELNETIIDCIIAHADRSEYRSKKAKSILKAITSVLVCFAYSKNLDEYRPRPGQVKAAFNKLLKHAGITLTILEDLDYINITNLRTYGFESPFLSEPELFDDPDFKKRMIIQNPNKEEKSRKKYDLRYDLEALLFFLKRLIASATMIRKMAKGPPYSTYPYPKNFRTIFGAPGRPSRMTLETANRQLLKIFEKNSNWQDPKRKEKRDIFMKSIFPLLKNISKSPVS